MTHNVNGIHHVTAIASDPRANAQFYTEVLGLRLVKRTVNFDDTSTYHLYYGDETGTPGTVLTFFPFGGGRRGRPGRGQATATAFVVPEGSLDYWADRLDAEGLDVGAPTERFGEAVLPFADPDGQPLELVAGESDVAPWSGGPIPDEHAIRGFHGVTLHSADPEVTGSVLEAMGYESDGEDGDRRRYRTAGERATVVDLRTDDRGPRGEPGVGTVHHVAFRTPDEESQSAWRDRLSEIGLSVTSQKDRRYFRSIYVREPGGVLFEIATDGPGFTRDESVAELGSDLKLPEWLEADRERIEAGLADLDAADPQEAD
ncbi:ring-cleaving dioxygenase [Halorussus marinus]|uniref:ring-cleaving dioxygenase n=1 Tax=Halorussus marinus TaxID=2505976 RepID=UPI001092C1D8|nr:ring-cleaving dioxygenase [Halorussus marinus]